MKRKTKMLISALSAMLVMVLAVTIVSFSLAGNGDEAETSEEQLLLADSTTTTKMTIIDRIIVNSIEGEDKVYKIVEVGSTPTPSYTTLADGSQGSFMEALAEGSVSNFKTYVIDGNKTPDSDRYVADEVKGKLMAADTVSYTYFYVNDVTDADLETISGADLLYVSNDPTSPYTPGSKDFSEELYSAILHTYTSNKKKPLIIDSPIDTAELGGQNNNTVTMSKLAHDVFATKGSRYYTFAWNQTNNATAELFFRHQNGSLYLGINGDKKTGNWMHLNNGTDPYDASKMLVISSSDTPYDTAATGTYPMTDKILDGIDASAPVTMQDELNADHKVYIIDNKVMYNYGYNARYSRPKAIEVTTHKLDETLLDVDFDKYDMIVIEAGQQATTISADLYKKFSAAMVGNVSIVYDSTMDTGTGSSSGTGSYDPMASNYNKLFSMIATSTGKSNMNNVMVTNRDDFGVIATSKSAATCKTIADLINASAFRTFGGSGNGSGSNTFTVLEIQPCYPIDRDLAAELGTNDKTKRGNSVNGYTQENSKRIEKYGYDNYYTVPANVVNNVTKEQVEEGTEYYAWEVSDAKIIDAIGDYIHADASQIKIVHMSTEELAASTTSIVGNYDMIYIGGNISAKKSLFEYSGIDGVVGWTMVKPSDQFKDITKLPIYTLYSHNGEITKVNLATTGESGGPVRGGQSFADATTLYAKDTGPTNQWDNGVDETFALLNGNDITYNKAKELIDYVNSGMPVIISKDLAAGYGTYLNAKQSGNPYLQNAIDPDSNMADVLDACWAKYNKNTSSRTVLWNFDNSKTYTRDNDAGRLGSTLTGYVTVYASSAGNWNLGDDVNDASLKITGDKDRLVSLYVNSTKRPTIEATKLPKIYDDTQADSSVKKNSEGKNVLEFEYSISGGSGNYAVTFYIDNDGNGRYTLGSEDIHQTFGATSGSYEAPDSLFGAFAWKLEVTDNDTGAVSAITGVSKIDMPVGEKKLVRVLQIMPGTGDSPVGEGSQGTNSLYFCTTCQQACMRLEYNPVANTTSLFSLYYQGSHVFNDSNKNNAITDGCSVGKHEHTFGIVKYDSTIDESWLASCGNWSGQPGADDWHTNLADEISDMYDFQIDIYTRGEVEAISDEVREPYNLTDSQKATKIAAFEAAIEGSTEFDDYRALTTNDEKATYIVQYEAEVEASKYWSLYLEMKNESKNNAKNTYTDPITGADVTTMTTFDAKAELDGAIDELVANLSAANATIGGMTTAKIAQRLEEMKNEGKYFNYFSSLIEGNVNIGRYNNDAISAYLTSAERSGKKYTTYYKDYVTAKDLELSYLEMYKKYDRIAHADNWIKGCYDTVIIGPSEDFAGDDFTANSNGLKDLVNYTKGGGTLLMFHDTFTRFANTGSANLTDALRPYVGMDKNHQEADTSLASQNTYYIPYKTIDGYDEDKYFIMNLNWKNDPVASRTTAWYESWDDEMSAASGMPFPSGKYLTSVAYSDSVYTADKSFNLFASPYRYAVVSWSYSAFWANESDSDAKTNKSKGYGTERASRNNQGLITLYPFSLSEKIYISGTHAQSYALDLEDDSTTVWYSLAGGYSKQEGSSMYAASPNDGMDSYFIYSYKNVYYCGAGHSKVTGLGKDNNDERKLYINIICNSVRPSASQPSIHIYDYQKDTFGDKIKQQGGSYYTTVDTMDDYVEFSFKVNTDNDAALKKVRLFFDLDYSETNKSNAYTANDSHVLIGEFTAPTVKSGTRFDIGRYIAGLLPLSVTDGTTTTAVMDTLEDGTQRQATRLRLLPRYFDPYNGEYTYIVIEAEDTNGNKVYQRIKIKLKDYLFNLT